MTEAIAVLGAGAWGTALAIALARKGERVALWARSPAQRGAMRADRENASRLPGAPFPDALTIASSLEDALDGADVALIAVPSSAVAEMAAELQRSGSGPIDAISCAKGLEPETGRRCCELIAEKAPRARAFALSGPSFAKDLAAGLPTAAVLAGDEIDAARAASKRLAGPRLRLYPSADPIGVELCGALKNVAAIAAGIAWGAGYGENARAALITRSLAEIARLVAAGGGRSETVWGLAGAGDLILSATSLTSRNAKFGYALGRGRTTIEAAEEAGLAEGARAARGALERARRAGVDAPIAEVVAAILSGRLDLAGAARTLLDRPQPSGE